MNTKLIDRLDLRFWTFVGFCIQVLLLVFAEIFFSLFEDEIIQKKDSVSIFTDLSIIEYQEPTAPIQQAQTKDLSETIIETQKPLKEEQVNWQNAVDPTLDFSQRYVAKISVQVSPDDYPSKAKAFNLGKVKVYVMLYISSTGKIKDVKVRNIESTSGNIDAFREDFYQAVRKIFLEKGKLLSPPYQVNGEYKDFIWYTSVTFMLE
ncbi:MAG: hypothetical protein NZ853_04480 [Leptospiraceae bacterium]|nr:hypothetical protein [Leptospiraceae bacterium]MDW7975431.1 hypothetical protein [Leptospiraceae bacterium]